MPVMAKEAVKEIACQQVLLQDASVFSIQSLVFPERYAHLLTAPLLLERYLKLVRDWTFSTIRPVAGVEGIQFRLVASSLAFLSFAPPRHVYRQEREEVHLRINGGVLVQARELDKGMFSFFAERAEGGLRVTVQISDYRPLLLGGESPSRLRRLFYKLTQAYIHKVLTVKYLSSLYRELTGEEVLPGLKKVRVREGEEI
jgi:hypothetical protein